jgi:hypothetical protein
MHEIKPMTVSACWRKLWSECISELTGFPSIVKDVNEIVSVALQFGGEGFFDMFVSKIEELIDCHGKELTEGNLQELVESARREFRVRTTRLGFE